MLLGGNDTPTFLFKQHDKVYIYIYIYSNLGDLCNEGEYTRYNIRLRAL